MTRPDQPDADGDAIVVRDATADDVETLVAFNLAMAAETESLTLDAGRLRAGVRAIFDQPGRGFYLVAQAGQGGPVVGSLMITREWSDWRNAEWWWIQSVYVAPPFRRRGVYRAMHQCVAERASAVGGVRGLRLYVERNNHNAQQTYRRLGMDRTHYEMFEQDFG